SSLVVLAKMSANGHNFVEWTEEFVSQERGSRVVHYFLKDSAGNSILAVVGNERSLRHMVYVVAEEFLNISGAENSVHAGFKWRSRREVVDWLTAMLSKQHLAGDLSESLMDKSRQAGHFLRNLKGQKSDIMWSGIPWRCGRQLKHYPSFYRNSTTIPIQSFVFVMAKEEKHYIAYLEDMYEDKKGQKKVKVRWFHHNQELKGVVPLRNAHPKEVFITPYAQVVSAECVDGPATVLTREDYKKCVEAFPDSVLTRIHFCFRQFRSNKVKPFDLRKLCGYVDQPILSYFDTSISLRPESICHDLNGQEAEDIKNRGSVRGGAKRIRTCRGRQGAVTKNPSIGSSGWMTQVMDCEPPLQNLKYGFSGQKSLSFQCAKSGPCQMHHFKVNDKIELLCQDSGIRGCWFRCKILHLSGKQMKVQYDDLQDEDGCGNLEEWIQASGVALPDKLGMRCSGRLTVRPHPPANNQPDLVYELGTPVDTWWSDGWWEGVVIGIDDCGDNNLQVYFPGENFFLNIHKKNLRISRDWVGHQWFDIERKLDILSVISSAIGQESDLSSCLSVGKQATVDHEVPSTKSDREERKLEVDDLANSTAQTLDLCNDEKQSLVQDKSHHDEGSTNDSYENFNACSNDIKLNDSSATANDYENNTRSSLEKFDSAMQKCGAEQEFMEVEA
ncbi:Bromo adjacent homology (BAH) domain, partial [Dillenia turbinata]